MHRLIAASLAVISLVLAWLYLAVISQTDPWYRNADMNIQNMVDALSINTTLPPHHIDQPGVPTKLLLALDYRILHYAGRLPVWNLKKLDASADPLRQIPPLIHLARILNRIFVMAFILGAGGLAYLVTREINAPCITIILLCGSSGLLFHGLLSRTELLCVFFGNILALLCTWKATDSPPSLRNHLWLFLAGLLGGISVLEKLPGVAYLAMCYGWCWLAALTAAEPAPESAPDPDAPGWYWRNLLPAAAGVAMLALLFSLSDQHGALGAVAVSRLRLAAVAVAVLPLLTLGRGRGRFRGFCAARARELALLGAGALTALLLCYLSICAVLTDAGATDYLARVLRCVIDPGAEVRLLSDNPDVFSVLRRYFAQDAVVFLSASALAGAVFLVRAVPRRLKALLALLLAVALGLIVLLSKRHFTIHYSIFYLAPLLLACALSFSALGSWWQMRRPLAGSHWTIPVVITASFALLLTAYFRLQPKYANYQDDAAQPVSEITLTLIFDHQALTQPYLKIMAGHYGNRERFRTTLDGYLADPANRY